MGFGMRPEQVERRLKLRELRILLAVVKAGSMAKGAAELAISQPNVSKAISDLEHAFGVRLLDRGPHGVEPTRYGLAVIKCGAAVFESSDTASRTWPSSPTRRRECCGWDAPISLEARLDW
jgi:DNA-binding transcriptional LysR family regulator